MRKSEQARIRRPKSLHEVAAESETYSDFGYNLKDFLHEFASATQRKLPLEPMLSEEPERLADKFEQGRICDAFLAGTADYFARKNRFLSPAWAFKPERVLDEPWFSEDSPKMRLFLLRDTPSAFKEKNIFVFESALNAV
jgi:hypothetical protein